MFSFVNIIQVIGLEDQCFWHSQEIVSKIVEWDFMPLHVKLHMASWPIRQETLDSFFSYIRL